MIPPGQALAMPVQRAFRRALLGAIMALAAVSSAQAQPGHMDDASSSPRAAPPEFRDLKADPDLRLEGNYLVEWEGAKYPRARIVLSKGPKHGCPPDHEGPCRLHFWRKPDAPWRLSGQATRVNQDGETERRGVGGEPGLSDRADGTQTLQIEHGYYLFGEGRGEETVTFRAGERRGRGEWSYGDDQSGESIWRRVSSRIERVEFIAREGKQWRVFEWSPGQPPVDVTVPWDSVWTSHGPGHDMRGNRPLFFVKVYGENMWGLHYPYISRETDLELNPDSYVCSDGSEAAEWTWCRRHNKTVAGMQYVVHIWQEATPGRKTFFFDGAPVPFNLVVPGWPEAASKDNELACTSADPDAVPRDKALRRAGPGTDLSGKWDGWGSIVMAGSAQGRYQGTYTDTHGGTGRLAVWFDAEAELWKGRWREERNDPHEIREGTLSAVVCVSDETTTMVGRYSTTRHDFGGQRSAVPFTWHRTKRFRELPSAPDETLP